MLGMGCSAGGSAREEGIGQWELEESVTPGIYSLDDYDFRKPNAWMLQTRQNPVSPQPGQIDVYDWPGRFVEHGHGEFYARIRQGIWQVEQQKMSGTGTAMGLAPGYTFTLLNASYLSDGGEYLVTAAQYNVEENRYASGHEGATKHQTDFTVIPAEVTFRASPRVAWPKTYGPQTAKVVAAGESIWTDKYGRIKVKFHWDRLAQGDETSSCWVRVSSTWVGQGFGGAQIPRVNDEVVVDFINGDPDRPIVTGRVYNEASMPPWALLPAAMQMGFLSRSKDGSADNANALRFEDKKGAEQVWIQAERNMDTHVKQDASHTIGQNHTHFIGANEEQRIIQDQVIGVKGNTTRLTAKTRTDNALGAFTIGSGESIRLECGKSVIELTPEGVINIVGVNFNITVADSGCINTTGGELHVNPAAPGPGHKGHIQAALNSFFTNNNQ